MTSDRQREPAGRSFVDRRLHEDRDRVQHVREREDREHDDELDRQAPAYGSPDRFGGWAGGGDTGGTGGGGTGGGDTGGTGGGGTGGTGGGGTGGGRAGGTFGGAGRGGGGGTGGGSSASGRAARNPWPVGGGRRERRPVPAVPPTQRCHAPRVPVPGGGRKRARAHSVTHGRGA